MGNPSAVFQYLSFCQCRWTIYHTAVSLRTHSGTNTRKYSIQSRTLRVEIRVYTVYPSSTVKPARK